MNKFILSALIAVASMAALSDGFRIPKSDYAYPR